MRTVPVESIILQDRQRKSFNKKAAEDLKASILSNGLRHPLSCWETEGQIILVAGERRLRAIKEIAEENQTFRCDGQDVQPGFVPITVESEFDEISAFEAELDENLMRADLTWQEKSTAVAELHRLRTAQNPKQTITDTAKEIKSRQSDNPSPPTGHERQAISRAMVISEFMDDDEVRKAADEKAAFKIVMQKLEAEFASARVETKERQKHTLIHGDMREVMKTLPAATYDLLLTDPPYGVGVKGFGGAAALLHRYDETNFEELYEILVEEATRVCAPAAHIYIFCDFDYFPTLRTMCENHGWRVKRRPLIWSKGNRGHLTDGDTLGYKSTYECILFAQRGGKQGTGLVNDVLHYPQMEDKYHAAQKPVELIKALVTQSTDYNQQVLDPFAGSGVIFGVCEELNRIATGIELDKEAVSLIESRQNVRRTDNA